MRGGGNEADRGIDAVEEGLVGEGDGGVELRTNAAEAGERRGRGLGTTGDLGSERGSHSRKTGRERVREKLLGLACSEWKRGDRDETETLS